MKLDDNLKKYLNSNVQKPLLIFIKVDAKKFEYSKLEASNEKNNPRAVEFQREMKQMCLQFNNCVPQHYLPNISLFEAVVDRTTIKQLIDFHAITGLQAIDKVD